MSAVDAPLTDALRFVPSEVVAVGRNALALDQLRLSEALVPLYGAAIVDGLRAADLATASQLGHVTLSDALGLLGRLYPAYNVLLGDTAGITAALTAQRGIAIIEQLGLSPLLVGNGLYHVTLLQALRLADKLLRFLGADAADALQLHDAALVKALAIAGITDTVGVQAQLTPLLMLNVVAHDAVAIHPVDAVRMLFEPTLVEGVELSAGMLEPNGSFSTWVMNTRSGVVTEYANFAFNSLAQIGNRCLGASESGLFELTGDTDAGTDIIARIKGGYLQFGGTQLSRLKEAYVAATGGETFVLKIITKDGDTYTYGIDTRTGRNAKVHMGKGMRARYFAFELTSVGQDFDLDTLEFVPIVVQRRV